MHCLFRSLVALLAGLAIVSVPAAAVAQESKGDDISFLTPDGLRLFGTWYKGTDGNANTVIMLHGLGQNSAKGDWQGLAKALNAEGFAVLTFDFRGHGKSTAAKTFDDKKLFCDLTKCPHNKFAGVTLNPNALNSISFQRFNPGYIPYLIYDIAGARSFVDTANDNRECNSGRIFLIGDREMCALGLFWMGQEAFRQAVNAPQGAVMAPQDHKGIRDIVGAVWLSPRTPNAMQGVMAQLTRKREITDEIGDIFQDKIGMAFVYGDEDRGSKQLSQSWFNLFRIKPGALEDKDKGKYMIEVKGAKKLDGVSLLEPKLGVEKQIIEFMKATKKKNVWGVPNTPRSPTAQPVYLALDKFGLLKP